MGRYWKANGWGSFSSKNKDKLKYKLVIKKAKENVELKFSNKLHEVHKKSKQFWKTWKNKVCNH